MTPAELERWTNDALDDIFAAVAGSPALAAALVFKGARVLNRLLGGGRASFDIDSNLSPAAVAAHPSRSDQREFLDHELTAAIKSYLRRQSPIRFELLDVAVKLRPAKHHPLGWNAFTARIVLAEVDTAGEPLPPLDLDIAAPEALLPTSTAPLAVGGATVVAQTLERIAGEKLRAFLSSLPAYRAKLQLPGVLVRAKDLYDLSRIARVRLIAGGDFWRTVGAEFQVACRSRYIDCAGLETFHESWAVTQEAYGRLQMSDVPFAEAAATLAAIVARLEADGVIPLAFPLPPAA